MSASPPRSETGARREAIAVAAMTAAGGLLRLWSPGRLGLVHFDEGIYAMAGTWVLSPKGLAGLDPTVIPYAPPGFPVLVGLAYGLLGLGDVSAILVSIAAGTLTIPLVGWLGYRTFGRGAGAAASALAALSGPHIAFSRMALTDCSFLLFWLLAIGLGQRFLERPGPARAIALGLAVGVAQMFKYNGWLAGAVVAAAAVIGPVLLPEVRTARRQWAVWGWGLVSVLLAGLVYWPWFRFVEAHGGYAALLAHHRRYMGTIATWPRHLIALFDQDEALSGGALWLAAAAFVATLGMLVAVGRPDESIRSPARVGLALAGFTALCAYPHSNWYGALFWLTVLNPLASRLLDTKANHFLVVAWAVLAIMTPFYHPYARLLLPIQGLGWVLMGGAFVIFQRRLDVISRRSGRTFLGMPGPWVAFATLCALVPMIMSLLGVDYAQEARLATLLEPSDSLRTACRSMANELPRDLDSLRLYARPPVTFYLSGVAPVAPQPTLDRLLEPGPPRTWSLLDAAMVREGRMAKGRLNVTNNRWELVREIPTRLNLPTMLDIDPSAATQQEPDRSAPLMLFRPRRPGAAR